MFQIQFLFFSYDIIWDGPIWINTSESVLASVLKIWSILIAQYMYKSSSSGLNL